MIKKSEPVSGKSAEGHSEEVTKEQTIVLDGKKQNGSQGNLFAVSRRVEGLRMRMETEMSILSESRIIADFGKISCQIYRGEKPLPEKKCYSVSHEYFINMRMQAR